MYEILEDEKRNVKKRNYRIYKEPKKVFDEYFYHGIEGRDELLEGIIFFSHNDEIARIQKTPYNKLINNKSELERIINRAVEIYLQFYRFVDLNDRDKVPHYYHLENERDLRNYIEEIIRNKLEQLENSNDDYMFISNEERRQNPQRYDEDERQRDNRIRNKKGEDEINRTVQRKIKDEERFLSRELNDFEKGIIYNEVKNNYLNKKKIHVDNEKISYSSRERLRYAHFPEGANPDNVQQYIIRHWTENVYDILSYLNKLEKKDKIEYYRIWLHTRIERLKNRGYIDDEVRKEIDLLTKQEEKVKEIQGRKKERQKKMKDICKEGKEER